MQFTVLHQDPATCARAGRLVTRSGAIDTPAYLPVGTQAVVRGLTPLQVLETGTRMILANTYHLHLRPGEAVVKEAGGLHRFMGWQGSILTDSGGFQVFSLAGWNAVDDDGVTFRSLIDGSLVRFTPETATAVQNDLGADIIMAFDQCPSWPQTRDQVARAAERTSRWARRCREAHRREDQALFGIIQGGTFPDLRRQSLGELVELDFPGYALGGVSVGESREEVHRTIAEFGPLLPEGKPRYLMGLGTAEDLLHGIASGVDLFDCVLATRNARNAYLFTRAGIIRIRNQAYQRDFTPLDSGCSCYTCRHFTKAYLRHLHSRKESLAGTLGSIHNIHYFQDLTAAARSAIQAGRFAEFYRGFPESFR
ncbi:MAG: tRNA guanosine(34) transglycosylase Tgt [Planctomycetes bacterium]|nr:tRNA guanosine(34) transglycosylase Tgt [Planctomycetota bacterium]